MQFNLQSYEGNGFTIKSSPVHSIYHHIVRRQIEHVSSVFLLTIVKVSACGIALGHTITSGLGGGVRYKFIESAASNSDWVAFTAVVLLAVHVTCFSLGRHGQPL